MLDRLRSTGSEAEPTDLIRSVSRALRIIEEVSRSSRPLPVKVIARRCELHLSTAYHRSGRCATRVTWSGCRMAGTSRARGFVDLAEGARSPWLEDLQPGLEAAAHATAVGKALLTALPGRGRRSLLAEHGLRPFTANTVTEQAQLEDELARLRPGDLVMERGQFRDQVCCAGVAVPGAERGSWWALGASARGLSLPGQLLAALQSAAADLSASAAPAAQFCNGISSAVNESRN